MFSRQWVNIHFHLSFISWSPSQYLPFKLKSLPPRILTHTIFTIKHCCRLPFAHYSTLLSYQHRGGTPLAHNKRYDIFLQSPELCRTWYLCCGHFRLQMKCGCTTWARLHVLTPRHAPNVDGSRTWHSGNLAWCPSAHRLWLSSVVLTLIEPIQHCAPSFFGKVTSKHSALLRTHFFLLGTTVQQYQICGTYRASMTPPSHSRSTWPTHLVSPTKARQEITIKHLRGESDSPVIDQP